MHGVTGDHVGVGGLYGGGGLAEVVCERSVMRVDRVGL